MKFGYRSLLLIAAGLTLGCGVFAACDSGEGPGPDLPPAEHTHAYEWTTEKAATCTVDGLRRGVCTVCGDVKTEEITAPGHDWIVLGIAKPATCTDKGVRSVECSVCGATDPEQTIPVLGHDWGDPVPEEGKEPTCSQEGYGIKTCKRNGCGAEEGTVIPAKGHEWPAQDRRELRKEATCTSAGEEAAICLVCGDEITREISATGHTFDTAYTITKSPTETEEGSRARLCTVCGTPDENSRRTIPALSSGEAIEYEFRLVRTNGVKLATSGVRVSVYEDGELVGAGPTTNGSYRLSLPIGRHTVKVDPKTLPAGYTATAEYSFGETDFICMITLEGHVIGQGETAPSSYRIGSAVQDFTLTTVKGERLTLSELLRTKTVILNFWATWCNPCREEFAALNTVSAQFGDDIVVIAVNSMNSTHDTEADVRSFANMYSYDLHIACESEYDLYGKFATGYFPTTVVIDKEGVVSAISAYAMNETQFHDLFARFATSAKTAEAMLPAKREQL